MSQSTNTEHFDVIIIGAGLSGIGAACHLSKQCPEKSYCLLEGRESMGGTWDLFRYPGVRSDSDMFTLGYSFKPWTSTKFLADGPSILNYIKEAAQEHNVDQKIRYNSAVNSISWDSDTANWTIRFTDKTTGKDKEISCNFIMSCTGYYSYESGYEPDFKGKDDFKGQVIHPQKWPEDLDYSGKKVVVIGSGATAVTLIPEMAKDTSHITMLQRSPTYMASVPSKDKQVETLRKVLPEKWVYRITRTQKVGFQYTFYNLARKFPKQVRGLLLTGVKQQIGPDVDMKHFKPSYNPWDERLCAVKSGDLFKSVKNGDASIVTDHIDHFTENGIQLKSGEHLDADIIVTATGLNLKFFGGIDISVDGQAYDQTEKMGYKGIMLEDLPNIGFTFGYTNASWTLKADLTAEFLCRVINRLDHKGLRQVAAVNVDPSVETGNFLDFQSGYVQRAVHAFPKMGSKMPWRLYQSYPLDLVLLRYRKLDDGILQFSNPKPRALKNAQGAAA